MCMERRAARCDLRRAEAPGLTLSDLDTENASVTVRRKGGKVHRAYLASGARAAVMAWLAATPNILPALFLQSHRRLRQPTTAAKYDRRVSAPRRKRPADSQAASRRDTPIVHSVAR